MSAIYLSKAGETVDYIAYKYYGTEGSGNTEAVLAANPGLADLGEILPAGVLITLPVVTSTKTSAGVRLWD
jgi:phage tail protein X